MRVFVFLWLAIIALVALLAGCATDPRSGRATWDVGATLRTISAVTGALAPPRQVPEPEEFYDAP